MALSQCIPGLENTSFFRVKSGSQPSRSVFFENLQFNHLYLTVTKAPWFPLEKKLNNTQKNQNSVKSASIRPGLHSSRHSLSQSGSQRRYHLFLRMGHGKPWDGESIGWWNHLEPHTSRGALQVILGSGFSIFEHITMILIGGKSWISHFDHQVWSWLVK